MKKGCHCTGSLFNCSPCIHYWGVINIDGFYSGFISIFTRVNIIFKPEEMKIAVPTRNNVVDDHFGHCAYYTIYTIEENKVTEKQTLPSPEGCGCKSNIAPVLHEMGVEVMLAGNMGEGAKNVLGRNHIAVIRGCSGSTDELVEAYLRGDVKDNGEVCHHHECH